MTGFKNWFRDTTMPEEVDDYEQLFLDCWHTATTEATNAAIQTIRGLSVENERLRLELRGLSQEMASHTNALMSYAESLDRQQEKTAAKLWEPRMDMRHALARQQKKT